MEADWYEDPLGRYDGRFFDGELWTKQVSASGTMATDPDFPPGLGDVEAVQSIDRATTQRASTTRESPGRVVAILEDSVADAGQRKRRGRDWRWLAVVAAAMAVAVLAGLVWGRSTETTAPIGLDSTEQDRVEDLLGGDVEPTVEPTDTESTGRSVQAQESEPAEAAEPASEIRPEDTVEVGRLRIANGRQILEQVHVWHESDVATRGTALSDDAGCWFATEDGAAVQVAYCGPVGSSGNDVLFDEVPLLLRTIDGQMYALATVDEYVSDVAIPDSLALVGHGESALPATRTGSQRGDRVGVSAN